LPASKPLIPRRFAYLMKKPAYLSTQNLMKKIGFQRCRLHFPEDRWQGSPPRSAKARKFHHAGQAIFDTIAFPNEKERFNENATGHRP
jgi:hypothetical protein